MIAYKVYANHTIILDTVNGINDGMVNGQLSIEVNEPGKFDFTLLRTHPQKNAILLYKTNIAVEMIYIDESNTIQDSYFPFLGRVISIDEDYYGNLSYQCEGVFAYLNDIYINKKYGDQTTVRPYLGRLFQDYGNIYSAHPQYYDSEKLVNFFVNAGSDANWVYGRDIEEIGEEAPKDEYRNLFEIVKSDVIDKIGGVFYIIQCIRNNNYYIESAYYNSQDVSNVSFDYSNPSDQLPQVISIYTEDSFPHFKYDTNIIDMSSSPIKTGIWTGIMPVGKDGLLRADDSDPQRIGEIVIWNDLMARRYGQIVKCVEFSEADTGSKLDNYAYEYLNRFASTDWYSVKNYTIRAVEPCLVTNFNKFVKICYPAYIQTDENNETVLNCLSFNHDLFNAQNSQYVFGPIIPQNIINEDISTWK